MNILERIKTGNWPLLKALSLRFGKKITKFDITKDRAMQLIGDTDIKVLDVRTPKEIEKVESLVEDAININFYKDFEKHVAKLDKNEEYLVVCSGGVRSRKACSIMEEQGFNNLYSLQGGMDSIKECGTWK